VLATEVVVADDDVDVVAEEVVAAPVVVAEEVVAAPVVVAEEVVVAPVVVAVEVVVAVDVLVVVDAVDPWLVEVVVTGLEVVTGVLGVDVGDAVVTGVVGVEAELAFGISAAAAARFSSPIVMPVAGSWTGVAESWIQPLISSTVGRVPKRDT
jgi:hypothetical protein